MARHIEIPIAFEWHVQPATWDLVTATVIGWALGSGRSKPHFQAVMEQNGARYLLQVPFWAFPKEILLLLQQEKRAEFTGSYSATLLLCSAKVRHMRRQEANPWIMREEFFRLKPGNADALLAFLDKWGLWGPLRTSRPVQAKNKISGTARRSLSVNFAFDPKKLPAEIRASVGGLNPTDRQELDDNALTYTFPFEIWQFQKKCREALKKPAMDWLPTQKLLALVPRREFPHYLLSAPNCQGAILNTIIIDLLKKTKFRMCARRDCGAPFSVETRHHREYCCQYCAHIESVRKQRRAAQKKSGRKD